MALKNERALTMLSAALEMEKKGAEFYAQAVKLCIDPAGREIFEKLAADEVVHQERIQKIFDQLKAGAAWAGDWKALTTSADGLRKMFVELARKARQKLIESCNDIEALDTGISMEVKSIEYYGQHLKLSTDPVEREFLERMIVEEKGHHAALTDVKFYLTDPAGYFAEVEGHHFDGA